MSDFDYTHNPTVHSSAVNEVWYNTDARELAVNLHGEVYLYTNVPFSRYQSLVLASSVGRAFREVKRDYGPSEYLGYRDDLDIARKVYPAADMSGGFARGGLVTTPRTVIHDETKAEPVTTGYATGPHISLKPSAAETRKYVVTFETDSGEHTHTLHANSVDEAADLVRDFASQFNINVKVTGVFVPFE